MNNIENPFWTTDRLLDWLAGRGYADEAAAMQAAMNMAAADKIAISGRLIRIESGSGARQDIPALECADLRIVWDGSLGWLATAGERDYFLSDPPSLPRGLSIYEEWVMEKWSVVWRDLRFEGETVIKAWTGKRQTSGGQKDCEAWLTELMATEEKTKTKPDYQAVADEKFESRVGSKAFTRAWNKAREAPDTRQSWLKPGPVKSS